ncbi:MAG: 3-deoxy-7-phosphoheptulonate synthase, partial [Verrucomicrobiota bacterium]
LRGGDDGPNYSATHIEEAVRGLEKQGLSTAIIVDASHANCAKDHNKQPEVFRNVLAQRLAGNKAIVAGMLESHLKAGKQSFPQPVADLEYGQSITDPCIDWETTEALIREAARALT